MDALLGEGIGHEIKWSKSNNPANNAVALGFILL